MSSRATPIVLDSTSSSSSDLDDYVVEEVSMEEDAFALPPTPPVVVAPVIVAPPAPARAPARSRVTDQVPPRGRRTQAGSRVRRFVFTLNNYTEEEHQFLCNWIADNCTWGVIGKETGDSCQTPHLQGACTLRSQVSFSTLKTLTGFQRAHLEMMKGQPSDSLSYCTKQDDNAFIYGELPNPGKRNDLAWATERIRAGASLKELARDAEGAPVLVKFCKGLTVYRSLVGKPRLQAPKVFWLYGSTGTGKTRCAVEFSLALTGSMDGFWISSGGLRWFDGYDRQRVAIFDDFRPKDVKFNYLLRLTDRYPLSVEFKGGFVDWVPDVIIITAPSRIVECFATRFQHVPEDIRQLERRVTLELEFPYQGDVNRTLMDLVVGDGAQHDGGAGNAV